MYSRSTSSKYGSRKISCLNNYVDVSLSELRRTRTSASRQARLKEYSRRRKASAIAVAELPKQLAEARRLKKQGLTASAFLVGSALLLSPLLGNNAPALPEGSVQFIAAGVGGLATLLLLARAALGERLLVEVHQGVLYLQFDPPSEQGPRLSEGAVEVRPSAGKGNGAFATESILQGTFLGDYEGEMLNEAAYWKRYPTGVADYCIGIDKQWTIDGRKRAKDTSVFSACHMNHSSKRHNVVRRCSRAERRVSFYTARDIQVGEELLLDYGKLYWSGREANAIE